MPLGETVSVTVHPPGGLVALIRACYLYRLIPRHARTNLYLHPCHRLILRIVGLLRLFLKTCCRCMLLQAPAIPRTLIGLS